MFSVLGYKNEGKELSAKRVSGIWRNTYPSKEYYSISKLNKLSQGKE